MIKVLCCGKEASWVENVPGKGYNFCGECRNEVLTPLELTELPKQDDSPNPFWWGFPMDKNRQYFVDLNKALTETSVFVRSPVALGGPLRIEYAVPNQLSFNFPSGSSDGSPTD